MLGEIENGILKKIQEAQAEILQYQFATMLVLNAPHDAAIVKSQVRQFPAIWFQYEMQNAELRQDGEGIHFSPHLVLWLQAKSHFNQSARRQDALPGLYQVMLDIAALLKDESFALAIEPLTLMGMEILPDRLDGGSYLASGKLTFKTSFLLPMLAGDETALEQMKLSWLHHDQQFETSWATTPMTDSS